MTLHVQLGLLSDRIFAGSVSKNGREWLANKTDVTGEVCAAVAQKALREHGGVFEVSCNGCPKWEITVREIGKEQP